MEQPDAQPDAFQVQPIPEPDALDAYLHEFGECAAGRSVLYEVTCPVIQEPEAVDYRPLFGCRLPPSIDAAYFRQRLQNFPFIQQDIYQRALPSLSFPPLPSVVTSLLADPDDYERYLPVNCRQLTIQECDELKRSRGADEQLKMMLEDYWLFYEPYIPKWPIDEEQYCPDEDLPPHASCFRSAYNNTVSQSAEYKKGLMIRKQTLQQGIDFNCFRAATALLSQIVPQELFHLLPLLVDETQYNGI